MRERSKEMTRALPLLLLAIGSASAFSLGAMPLASAQHAARTEQKARGGASCLRAMAGGQEKEGAKLRALCVLATGFEEMETVAPIDILRRASIDVTVAALSTELTVKGRNGMFMVADTDLDSALAKGDYDCVIIPGGPPAVPSVGTLASDGRVVNLLKSQMSSGRLVSAICAAPSVLMHAGVLEGKKYTAHFSVRDAVPAMDKTQAVVVDSNLVTSQGAGTATEFALALVEQLVDKKTADDIAASICWKH
jgi:4-methyl-5(b-hydroxyethyl)-thiazole monophosphate biosynthesis